MSLIVRIFGWIPVTEEKVYIGENFLHSYFKDKLAESKRPSRRLVLSLAHEAFRRAVGANPKRSTSSFRFHKELETVGAEVVKYYAKRKNVDPRVSQILDMAKN